MTAPDEVFEDPNNGANNGGNNGASNGANNGSVGGCDDGALCSGDSLCEGGVCRAACGNDDDCGVGEVCEVREDGPGRVCVGGLSCGRPEGDRENCTTTWNCNDNTTRTLSCDIKEAGVVLCTCLENDEPFTEFEWDDIACEDFVGAPQLARNICDWDEVETF